MVSGFNTSPYERSRITSGEARLMVILLNPALGRLSFFTAMFFYYLLLPVETQNFASLTSLRYKHNCSNFNKVETQSFASPTIIYFIQISVPGPNHAAHSRVR